MILCRWSWSKMIELRKLCWQLVSLKREAKNDLDYPEELIPFLEKIEEIEDELIKLQNKECE